MPFIPFGLWPGHWGLRGLSRDLARVDYEYSHGYTWKQKRAELLYTGDELAQKLDDIDLEYELIEPYFHAMKTLERKKSGEELEIDMLYLQLEYKKISQREFDQAMIDRIQDQKQKDIAALDLLLEHKEITEQEYEREIATIEDRPYFHWDVDYIDGELELSVDWNEQYIEFLRNVGYGNDSSATDDDVINEYVRDFGRKLSEDHPEDNNAELGHSFIKSIRESNNTTSYL